MSKPLDVSLEKKIIHSKVKSELLQKVLLRGSFIGSLGAALIILCGSFLPLSLLKIWGIPLFFVGICLIGIGILPYKRLSRLQLNPHLFEDCENHYLFSRRGKPLLIIPKTSIESLCFSEKDDLYGISICLKKPLVEKVKVLQSHFDISAFSHDSLSRFGSDLFLPYFMEKDVRNLSF